jgi:UDP-glucose 4-epimerase
MDSAISGKTYLITGGASLIGSHVTDQLLEAGAKEVRLFDNYSLGTSDTIAHLDGHPKVKAIRGDILRLNELLDACKGVDGVFALAGFLTLPMSQNPPLGVAVNTIGMVNVMEAARIQGVGRVIFSSSVSAYGTTQADALSEDVGFTTAGQQPVASLYGSTKLLGEALGKLYTQKYGVQFNALRFSSVYGERQHARAVNAVYIAQVYDQVRSGERPVIVGDGSEVHDYIYVTDVAAGCLAAMTNGTHGETFNIVTGVDTSLTQVVQAVLELCKSGLEPEYREDQRAVRSASVARLAFDPAKAKRVLGWTPKVSVKEGIRRYIDWRKSLPGGH